MAVVYYCPICNKFSKDDSTNDTESMGFCKNCNQYSKYPVMNEEVWLQTKLLKSNRWDEYKKDLRELYQKRYNEDQIIKNAARIVVTTADLHVPYEVIGPVYFQINDRSNNFTTLENKYTDLFKQKSKQLSGDEIKTSELLVALFLPVERIMFTDKFDKAFFIAVEELKYRASLLGADAIVGMRQDLDLDTNGIQHFYLQMYGTAVKYIK